MFYAQMDNNNVVYAVTQTAGPINKPNLIKLKEFDISFIGQKYENGVFTSPPASADPTDGLIDVSAFFDRFGPARMSLLLSTSPVAQVLVKDFQMRKYIDLRRPDVAAGFDALLELGIPGVDAALKDAVILTPVAPEEKRTLRREYF